MRTDVILQRWLPIGIIMVACYWLVFATDTKISENTEKPEAPIELPADPRDYAPPPIVRDPFDLGALTIQRAAPRTEEAVKKSTETVKKKEIDPASLLFLNAIFWDEKTPMVSINGKVVGVGGEYSPNIKVQSITRNSVTLSVNGRTVVKTYKD